MEHLMDHDRDTDLDEIGLSYMSMGVERLGKGNAVRGWVEEVECWMD